MATLTCNNNPLQPTGFRLIIDRTNYPNLQFFASTVNHPAIDLPAARRAAPRVSEGIPYAGEALTFGELSVNILVDEDMESYTELYNWMIREVNNNYQGKSRLNDAIPSESDITLQILTSHNNKNKEIKYRNCVPTSLGSIALSATSPDVEALYVDATFAYSHFELVD